MTDEERGKKMGKEVMLFMDGPYTAINAFLFHQSSLVFMFFFFFGKNDVKMVTNSM